MPMKFPRCFTESLSAAIGMGLVRRKLPAKNSAKLEHQWVLARHWQSHHRSKKKSTQESVREASSSFSVSSILSTDKLHLVPEGKEKAHIRSNSAIANPKVDSTMRCHFRCTGVPVSVQKLFLERTDNSKGWCFSEVFHHCNQRA